MSSAGEHSDTSLSGLVALHRQLICAADADVHGSLARADRGHYSMRPAHPGETAGSRCLLC